MRLLFALPLCAVVLTGCGTVLSTPVQKVHVTSRPAGAEVHFDGMNGGVTPTTVELSRWEDHDLTLELRGYRTAHVHLSRRINPSIAGKIKNGIIFGVLVDASTGAIYKLEPPEVQQDFFPRGVRRSTTYVHEHASAKSNRGGEVLVATVLQAKPGWKKIGQMERL
jgi:hypothetical protein